MLRVTLSIVVEGPPRETKVNPTSFTGDTNVAVRSPAPNHTPEEIKKELPKVSTLPIESVKDGPTIVPVPGKVSILRPKPVETVAACDTLTLATKTKRRLDFFTFTPH